MGVQHTLRAPYILFDRRIELVVPPLTALLAGTTRQARGNHRPALGAVLLDERAHHRVLLRRPRPRARVTRLASIALITIVACAIGTGERAIGEQRLRRLWWRAIIHVR